MSDKIDNLRCFSQPLIHLNGTNNVTPVSLPTLSLLNDYSRNSVNFDKVHLSLSVLRLDPADRAVIKIADERDAIQKKAFTNWVNQHLVKRNCWVQDLFLDLRNGYLLVRLLECLTNEVLGLEYIESRVHWIQNIQRVLDFLRYRGIRIVNIRADEIVDGNPKLTLGLIWIIILHFQLAELIENQTKLQSDLRVNLSMDNAAKQTLLSWCRAVTANYPGVYIKDFTESWKDGRAFLALIHRYRPDLIDFRQIDRQSTRENLDLTFDLAERELEVTRLFDSDDIAKTTDERSIITYVASIYDKLVCNSSKHSLYPVPIVPPMPSLYHHDQNSTSRLIDSTFQLLSASNQLSDELKSLWSDYRILGSDLIQWLRSTTDRMANRHFPSDLKSMQERVMDEIRRHRRDERPRRERERQQLVRMYEELKPSFERGLLPIDLFLRIEQIHRLWDEYDIALQERELAARNETHRLDRLQWAGNRALRDCIQVQAQLTALERRVVELKSELPGQHIFDTNNEIRRWCDQLTQIEAKINGLFNQVQHLRTGRYMQTEQIYRNVCTLHQKFLDLQRLYREFTSSSTVLSPPSVVSSSVCSTSMTMSSHSTFTSLKNGTILENTHLIQGKLISPIEQCLQWIMEHSHTVQTASYGANRKSVEEATRRHEQFHREVLNFKNEIDRCKANQQKLPTRSKEEKQVLNESLQILEQNYQQLMEASLKRRNMSKSLLEFVERAYNELIWLREHESFEVTRDWTEIYHNELDRIRIDFQKLMHEIHEKEIVYSELSVLGSSIQLENYDVTDLVQTYLNALERHWAWLLQLTYCFEAHIEQSARFQSFFNDVEQCELLLTTSLEELRSLYESTLNATTTEQGETLLKQLQELHTRVIGQESFIFQLVDISQEIIPPIPSHVDARDSSTTLIGRRIRVLCSFQPKDYFSDNQSYSGDVSIVNSANTSHLSIANASISSIIEPIFWPVGNNTGYFDKGDFFIILENPENHKLQVRTANGSTLTVPLTCFLPCWPSSEAMDRAKRIITTLQHFKTCWSELNLRIHGHLLTVTMSKFIDGAPLQYNIPQQMDIRKVIYRDAERYCLELQLANVPATEVEKFKQRFLDFQNSCIKQVNGVQTTDDKTGNEGLLTKSSEIYSIIDELRTVLSTLTVRLRESNSIPLPGRSIDMEVRIKDHKEWSHALARVRAQCTGLEEHINSQLQSRSLNEQDTLLSTSLYALHRAASELALTGHEFSCRLADADAWIARLEQTDQILTDCELCLLGCAVRVHGLLQLDDLNSSTDPDGLRVTVVERAHRDLKSVAERLPQIRTDLDLLSQQLTRFMVSNEAFNETLQYDTANLCENSNLLKMHLSPCTDNHYLESNLACSEHRLAEATKEVEQELKSFGESLVCFSNYQKLSSQLIVWSSEFSSRMRSFGEMAQSLGLKSSDTNMITVQNPSLLKEILKQSDDLLTDLQVNSDVMEQLNKEVAHLISSLTNYAQHTQNYRELVESVFQKAGGSRDYQWSPGYGLFDMGRVLQTTDQLNEQFNTHSRRIYDIVNCLNRLLRSEEPISMNLSGPIFVKPYRELYVGKWPNELNNCLKETQSSFSPLVSRSKYQENGKDHTLPLKVANNSKDKNHSDLSYFNQLVGEKGLKYSVYLNDVRSQPVCLLPTGWEAATLTTISKARELYGPKIFPTTGAWFVTNLAGENETYGLGETICLGDALRCGLIDLVGHNCHQNRSSLAISWSEAIDRGWLTAYTIQALNRNIKIGDYSASVTDFLTSPSRNPIDRHIDPKTGVVMPYGKKVIDLYSDGFINEADFHHLASILSSGMCVEFRDCHLTWYEALSIGQADISWKPCLSDWLAAGAYNPNTRRLRVSLLKSGKVNSKSKTSNNSLVFTENELTIRDAIKNGLLDNTVPEVILPVENQVGDYHATSYRRVSLSEAVQIGLVDDVSGYWLGSSSSSSRTKVGVEVAQAAGLLTKAPCLAEIVLSGLISFTAPNMSEKHPRNNVGILDAHTGQYVLFPEAIKRGMIVGNQPAIILMQSHPNQVLTLVEALNTNLITPSGFIILENKPMNLWDAVNNNYIRLIYTKSYPPPVGLLLAAKESNQTHHQHPILQAILTGLIDSSKEEIILSSTDPRQHGTSSSQQRISLRKSAKHSGLCDLHSIQLLTHGCGLFNEDGRELTGLEALNSGWLKPCEDFQLGSTITYGQITDPVSGSSIILSPNMKTMKNIDISPVGAQLLLGLSINRPSLAYLINQRFITRLAWLGPGLHNDNLINKTLNDSWFTHSCRSDDILAVIDPISRRKITQSEAIRRHLLDMETGTFRDPVHNQIYPISEAIEKGHILVKEKSLMGNTSSVPHSLHSEVNESVEMVSVKETRLYKILNVLDPRTGIRIDPNEAAKKGLINLESFTYHGVQPSIPIESAQQLGYISIYGNNYEASHDSLMVDSTDKLSYTLAQLFNSGQLVKQSGSKCVIKVPGYTDPMSLNAAITLGLVNVEHSIVKEFNTEKLYSLDKAILVGLINDHKGLLLYKNKWIPLTDAINRGLIADKKLPTEIPTFEEALEKGLIDPASNTFHQSDNNSNSNRSYSINVHDAIKQGLLKPPATETFGNLNSLPNKGYTHSMDSLLAIKRRSAKDSNYTAELRNNTLPPIIPSGHLLSNGNDFIANSGRTESKLIKFLDCHGVGRLRGKSSHCNLRSKSTVNDGDEYTIRKKPRVKSCDIPKLKERNCVLYAFYYLHDDVRVEASITDTMVREGRVDVHRKTICDPISGQFYPIPEALTKGFVFGIVFTQAEQHSENDQRTSNSLYWLEVFHYRHDIYRLERVFDPYLNSLVSVSDAIGTGIIDPIHCSYTHPVSGNLYSIEEALYQGWIQALPVGNPPPFDLIGSSFDHVHVRTVEETTTFTRSVHTILRSKQLQNNINKEICSPDQKSMHISPQTTLNVQRQIQCKTPPSYRPTNRILTDSSIRYKLKSDNQITPSEINHNIKSEKSEVSTYSHPNEQHYSDRKQEVNKTAKSAESETTRKLISQLSTALDEETSWITGLELKLLQMGNLTLDDNLNRHLLDDHQEILNKIRTHQSSSRSVLFQAEQAIETLRHTNQPESIWKQLEVKCQELRTRLEDLQTEAEGRVRILLHSLDSLEHLTYKLQSLRNLLENLDSVLLVNTPSVNTTTTTTIGENQLSNKLNTINHPDEIDSCILRIKAALSESNSSHNNVISTLPSVKQKFIASVNRYADSKKTYNIKLNHFTGLNCKQYEDKIQRNNIELEDRIEYTVKEANNRLLHLIGRLEIQSTYLTEINILYKQYEKHLSESIHQLDKTKLQLNIIQKSLLRSDELNTLTMNKIKKLSQERLTKLYTLQGDLNKTENDLKNLKSVELDLIEKKFTEANLITNNSMNAMNQPLDNALNYQKQLIDQCEKLQKQFMKYLLTNQTTQECLNEFLNQTNRIGDQLSNDYIDHKMDEIKKQSIEFPLDMNKLNETLAQINSIQSASQILRNRLNQTIEQIKTIDPNKLRLTQSELKQTDILDNRLETLKDDVISRISQLDTLQNQLTQYDNDINEFNIWLDEVGNQLNCQTTAHLPENYLKHKLQSIKMLIPNRKLQLDNIQQSINALLTKLPESDDHGKLMKENMNKLNNRWSQLLHLINTREDDLKARESFNNSYAQARNQVQDMLLTADGRLTTLSSPITLNLNSVKQQMDKLNELYSLRETIKQHLDEVDQLGSAYDTLLNTSSGSDKNFGRGTTSSNDAHISASSAVPRVSTSAAYKQSKDNKLMNVLSPMASSGSSGISSADPMCNLHEINEVNRELDELHERYDQLGNCLNERRNEFKSLIINLNNFEEKRLELINWLGDYVKTVNNVNRNISTVQSVNQAVNELKKYRAQFNEQIPKLEIVRQSFTQVLHNRDHMPGAVELRNSMHSLEQQWNEAVVLNDKSQQDLNKLQRDLNEFHKLDIDLTRKLQQKANRIHSVHDKCLADNIMGSESHLNQISTLRQELDSVVPELNKFNHLVQNFKNLIPESLINQLDFNSTNERVRNDFNQLVNELSKWESETMSKIEPKTNYEQLVQQLDSQLKTIKTKMECSPVKEPVEKTNDLNEINKKIEEIKPVLEKAEQLCTQLCEHSINPTDQCNMKAKLLDLQHSYDQLINEYHKRENGKTEHSPSLPSKSELSPINKLDELNQWVSVKNKQLQNMSHDLLSSSVSHTNIPETTQIESDLQNLESMSEELKVKQRELQDLKENNKLNSSSLPMDSKTIDLCINQMNLLQNAVTAQQRQLKSRTSKEFLLSDQLEQLEVWITNEAIQLLNEPIAINGKYLDEKPIPLTNQQQTLQNRIQSICNKQKELNSLKEKLSHIKTYNDQPNILTEYQQNELQISTNGLQNKLNKLENDVKLKLSHIDDIQKAYSAAQNSLDTYKHSCDDLETRWLNLQQVLSTIEVKDLLKSSSSSPISSSPPSSPSITKPSNQIKQIRGQMIELQSELLELTNHSPKYFDSKDHSSNISLVHQLNQLELLIQSYGDKKSQQSMQKLFDELQLTTKRLETIEQALEMNFEMFQVKDMDPFSIHFIKKLNYIYMELQNIQFNINENQKIIHLNSETTQHRIEYFQALLKQLNDCKQNVNDGRSELADKMVSLPDERKLSPIYSNFLTTLNQYDTQCNNMSKQIDHIISALNNRVKQTEQMATLRQNINSLLKKVRESRQLPLNEQYLQNELDVLDSNMKSLKELSEELCKSPNDSSDKQISSHQLEYEIKTLENVIHEELANSKSVIPPEKQAERLISHLRDTLVEVQHDLHILSNQLSSSSNQEMITSIIDDYHTLNSRILARLDHFEQLDQLIQSIQNKLIHNRLNNEKQLIKNDYNYVYKEIQFNLNKFHLFNENEKLFNEKIYQILNWLKQKQICLNESIQITNTTIGNTTILIDLNEKLKQLKSLSEDIENYHTTIEEIKLSGEQLCESGRFLVNEDSIQNRLVNLSDIYEELQSDTKRKLFILESALPVAQSLTSSVNTLSSRLLNVESRLNGLLENNTKDVSSAQLEKSLIDQLEYEMINGLEPQYQQVHSLWNQLKQICKPIDLFINPSTLTTTQFPNHSDARLGHVEQIDNELRRYDEFNEKLTDLAKIVGSNRQKAKQLMHKLEIKSQWLDLALKRFDPKISTAPSLDWDNYSDENHFIINESLEKMPTIRSLGTEFPYLAVLPYQPVMLDKLHERIEQFQGNWKKYQIDLTQLCDQIHDIIQSSALSTSSTNQNSAIKSSLSSSPIKTNKSFVPFTTDKFYHELSDAVSSVSKQMITLDNRLSQTEIKFAEVYPLAKCFTTDMYEFQNWLQHIEEAKNEIADNLSDSSVTVDDLGGNRKRIEMIKNLDDEIERQKSVLDRILRTSGPLLSLIAPNEANTVRLQVKQICDHYANLRKLIKTRAIKAEANLKQSDEFVEQLNSMSDLFSAISEQAVRLGVPLEVPGTTVKPSILSNVQNESSKQLLDQHHALDMLGRIHSMTSVQPDHLQEHISGTSALMEALECRLPELEALTISIRAQLESKPTVKESTTTREPGTVELIESVDLEAVLKNADKLQTDWIQLHNKLNSRVITLQSAYKTSSEQFWPIISDLRNRLDKIKESLNIIGSGCSLNDPCIRRDPLDSNSYKEQCKDLFELREELNDISQQLNESYEAGQKLINLINGQMTDNSIQSSLSQTSLMPTIMTDSFSLRRDEEQAIRNEVDYALHGLKVSQEHLVDKCECLIKQLNERELCASQFKSDLINLIKWLTEQESVWDNFQPISNNVDIVTKQLDEIVQWNDNLMNKHSEVEALNWLAGKLMSNTDNERFALDDTSDDGTFPVQNTTSLQSDLTVANRRWDNLLDSGNSRRHRLQTVLLGLGEFESAIDGLIKWIDQMQTAVDQIPIRRANIRGLEADLARIKVIHHNINSHQLSVVRIEEQARKLERADCNKIDKPSGVDTDKDVKRKSQTSDFKTSDIRDKIIQMNKAWEHLKLSVRNKQAALEEALSETFNFHGQLDQLIRRTRQLKSRMPPPGARIMGGLPDSAREQLRRFMEVYDELVKIGSELDELRRNSAALLVNQSAAESCNQLTTNLERFSDHYAQLLKHAQDIRDRMELGLKQVEELHDHLSQMMQWLTQMERTILQQKPVSRIVARLFQLIRDHTELRKEITGHRDALINLDRLASQIQCQSQKQDVILVKNLLSSIHTRWEQLVSRSAERTRQLNTGLKEASNFLDNWTSLTDWLKENLASLEEDGDRVATRPEKVAYQLALHRELQRALSTRTVAYDGVRRYARQLRDRAPVCDHDELDDMVSELKHLWQAVCTKALARQRTLEQALLAAGLYKEALEALLDWLSKIEPQLAEQQTGNYGDVDIVEQLLESHNRFKAELEQRATSVKLIHQAASDLMNKASSTTDSGAGSSASNQADVFAMQAQLNHLSKIWDRVQNLTQRRSERLDHALKMAQQFQDTCRSLMDYFAGAERVIHRLAALPTFDDDGELEIEIAGTNNPPTNLTDAITAHRQTHSNLMNQADRVEAALQLGNKLLSQAHPAAVKRLRQWVNTIRTRWEELTSWSEQRGDRLQEALEEQNKRKLQREELMHWIHVKTSELKSIPTSIPISSLSSSSTNLQSAKSKLDSNDSKSIDSKDLFSITQERIAISTITSLVRQPNVVVNSNSSINSKDLKQPEILTDFTTVLNEITDSKIIEQLLNLHSHLEEEVRQKQLIYENIIKHAKRRTPVKSSHNINNNNRRSRLPIRPSGNLFNRSINTANQQHNQSISVFTSPNINQLYLNWRELWIAMLTRKSQLNERLAYLNEVEKMKDFHFESWRQRYVSWLSTNKARVIDLFHRKDRDRDGRLTRAEFIDGIIEMKFQTSRVEMETVADIFDANGDGYIDYRECLNALRANYSNLDRTSSSNTNGGSSLSLNRFGPSDEETINDELKRQVGLCTCHNTYKIKKMATNKYRFGDSQKLCLVRILRSAVMVRVGGGWVTLDEFLVKNDPCRAPQWKPIGDFNEDLHSSSDCAIAPITPILTTLQRKSSSFAHRLRSSPTSQYSTTSASSYASLPTSNHDLNVVKNNDENDNTITDNTNANSNNIKYRHDRQAIIPSRHSAASLSQPHRNSMHGETIYEKSVDDNLHQRRASAICIPSISNTTPTFSKEFNNKQSGMYVVFITNINHMKAK
ncbi:unnamed protein product [Schistosoma haematobium]|nr:unnamed protein product [Schistosoma haematobium]